MPKSLLHDKEIKNPKKHQLWWWTTTHYPSQCVECSAMTPADGLIAWNAFFRSAKCVRCAERHKRKPERSRRMALAVTGHQEPTIPSPREVLDKRSPRGAWTRAQLAEWGIAWPPPKGWRRNLEDRYVAQEAGEDIPPLLPPQPAKPRGRRKPKETTHAENMAAMKKRNAAKYGT